MLEPRSLERLAIITAIILELAATVVLGILVGDWLDERLGTTPVLLIGLSLGALVVGMTRLVTRLQGLPSDDDDSPPHA